MTKMLTHKHRKELYRESAKPISRGQYEALLDRLEDIEDTLAALAAEQRGEPTEDAWPSELVDRMIRGESRLRLWREHRELTLAQLSKKTGIAKGYLSEVENKKKPGSAAALKKCAQALRIDLDDLV
jgi:hypothetical protein